MNILTLDFETYYSQEFSLSKITNEEYVRSHEFEVIGVSVQIDDGAPEWFTGTMAETAVFLRQFDWENSLAQLTMLRSMRLSLRGYSVSSRRAGWTRCLWVVHCTALRSVVAWLYLQSTTRLVPKALR